MSCLPCTVAPTCNCTASQTCALTVRTCIVCSVAFCQDRVSAPSAPSTLGTTIGGALGGVLGVLAILGCIYWFWWKDRGLAASRQRYSRHLSKRESKLSGIEKRGLGNKGEEGFVRKRSIHLKPTGGEESLNHRNTGVSPYLIDDNRVSDTGATGERTSDSIDSLTDNPFEDHARHSLAAASTRTSDFSFRSSQSTNIIPIAYIPPNSGSLSHEGTHRLSFGELEGNHRNSYSQRNLPPSLLSPDSIIEMGIMEPIAPLNIHARQTSANGAPLRPPRSPGLDLQLPTTTPPILSPPHSAGLAHSRNGSGFPWTAPPPSNRPGLLSTFSSSSRDTRTLSADKRKSQLSFISTTSSVGTSRSGGSTMSYILDPPQIITPVDSRGLRRVEVLGRERGGLVRLPGNGVLTPPAQSAENPFVDQDTPRQRTETEESSQTNQSRWTASSQGSDRESLGTRFTHGNMSSRDSSTTTTGENGENTGEKTRSLMNVRRSNDSKARSSVSSNTTVDGTDSQSLLNGIEFSLSSSASADSLHIGSTTSSGSFLPLSPSFPLPPAVSVPMSPGNSGQSLAPLEAPVRPFAVERPMSTTTIGTVGTRYGSGLDGIPFQLGFGGIGNTASERGSTFTVSSFMSDDVSFVSAQQGTSLLSRPSVEPLRVASQLETDDPFGKSAEVKLEGDRDSTLMEASERARRFLEGEQ